MSDIIEAVARAIWSSQSSVPWEQGVTGAYQAAYRRLAQAAIAAHTAALVEGAGELCERLRSHTSAEDAWYDIDEAAATIAALRAELATARLEGVRLGIEAAAKAGYVACASTRHVSLGDTVKQVIRALDPAAIVKGE